MILQKKPQNFLLVSILPKHLTDEDALFDLQEAKALIESYGGHVKDLVVQRRETHEKGMYIGRGKLEEVVSVVKEKKIDCVVLNAIIKPGQIFAMKNRMLPSNPEVQVWDRVDLILHIFSAHAQTSDAKLQIELAAMRHMGPRIYGMGDEMSRQGGGIGTLGIGETNTELMRRHWRDQMKKVQVRLTKHTHDRERQLNRRARNGIRTISLIGYTNAGKTSLFNLLTKKNNLVRNALFVTLDSSVGKLYLSTLKEEIILSDTIGFIQNLPMSLLDAFQSTLLESIHADILLLVIDSSDTQLHEKIATVEKILYGLQLEQKTRLYVFNKIDALAESRNALFATYKQFHPQFISVKKQEGISTLLSALEQTLAARSGTEKTQKKRRKVLHYK